MGLNRFYTFNGQILKTAEGNPIGYESFPWPSDKLYARWTFSNTLVDTISGVTFANTGASSYNLTDGPGGSARIYLSDNYLYAPFVYNGDLSISVWHKCNTADYSTRDHFGLGGFKARLRIDLAKILINATQIDYDAASGWRHNVVTYSVTTGDIKVYRDSVLKGTVSGATDLLAGMTVFYLNAREASTSYAKNSSYGFTYLYKKVLTQAEVTQLYNSGNGI